MTLDEFRALTKDLPGTTKLYYHAYDKGCCLGGYTPEDMWFYPKGEATVGIVINPGPGYDDRRPHPQTRDGKEIETKKEESVEQDAIKELLRVARCPDPNCDNNGSSWHAEWGGGGEAEQVQHECQWCDERTKALKEKT